MIRGLSIHLVMCLLFISQFLFEAEAQKAELKIVKHNPEVLADLSLMDSFYNTLIEIPSDWAGDTLFMKVDFNKKFYLNLNNYKFNGDGDLLLSLYLEGTAVIVVHSDIEAGDHQWEFYSGIEKPALRIVGGSSVSIQDYPWQVFIETGDYLCGGTIIADKWVLTAAHCLFDEDNNRIPNEDIKFIAGVERPFSVVRKGEEYPVSLSVIHEGYDPVGFLNDLALLRTDEVISHPSAQPINLITEEEVNNGLTDPGAQAIITGWGLTRVEPVQFPDNLQKLDLPIVSNTNAEFVWGPIPEGFIMAGYINGEGDACSGDSGGPLIVRSGDTYKLAGVISWGSSGCNSLGGYVKISDYIDWITRNTGVGQNQFTTVRPTGDDFLCQQVDIGSRIQTYTADETANLLTYEWRIEPPSAGSISFSGNSAEVIWSDDFVGEAYVSARAVTANGITNWAGQRVVISAITSIVEQPGDTAICFDSKLVLDIVAEGSSLTYNWFRNGELIKTGDEPFYDLSEEHQESSANYYVEVTGGCGDVVSDPVLVNVLPLTAIEDVPDYKVVMNGEDLLINPLVAGWDLSYTWFKEEDAVFAGDKTLFLENVDANSSGIYHLKARGRCGIAISDDIRVYVDPSIPDFPEGMNIWPTLTTGEVNIALNTDEIFDIYIYNSMGLRIGSLSRQQYTAKFDLSRFAPDIYIIEVRLDEEKKIYRVVKV